MLSGRPGAMMTATTLPTPSTLSWPAVPPLISGAAAALTQFGDTAYHSGSFAPSTSLSRPNVRHGSRPTVFCAANVGSQLAASRPSLVVPASAADSGHGRRPGTFSARLRTCFATWPMRALFACSSAAALRLRTRVASLRTAEFSAVMRKAQMPMPRTAATISTATPRCLARARPYTDLTVADHVAHLARAAVERFARAQRRAPAGFAERDRDAL